VLLREPKPFEITQKLDPGLFESNNTSSIFGAGPGGRGMNASPDAGGAPRGGRPQGGGAGGAPAGAERRGQPGAGGPRREGDAAKAG
jgi:hypothetical protein